MPLCMHGWKGGGREKKKMTTGNNEAKLGYDMRRIVVVYFFFLHQGRHVCAGSAGRRRQQRRPRQRSSRFALCRSPRPPHIPARRPHINHVHVGVSVGTWVTAGSFMLFYHGIWVVVDKRERGRAYALLQYLPATILIPWY